MLKKWMQTVGGWRFNSWVQWVPTRMRVESVGEEDMKQGRSRDVFRRELEPRMHRAGGLFWVTRADDDLYVTHVT